MIREATAVCLLSIGLADAAEAQNAPVNQNGPPFQTAGCTVGTVSQLCAAANIALNHMIIYNSSASATIACSISGTAAILNDPGSISIAPHGIFQWVTEGPPRQPLNCISSAVGGALYIEYN